MDKAPIHEQRDSLFSTSSGWTDYRGFFNLAILLLIVSNGRVALENVIKYGILISPICWFNDLSTTLSPYVSNVLILVGSNVTIISALLVEKALAASLIGNKFAFVFYLTLLTSHLTIPAVVVLHSENTQNPLYSFIALIIIVIETLKLISYAHVNYWCRISRESDKEKSKENDERKRNAEKNSNGSVRSISPSQTVLARRRVSFAGDKAQNGFLVNTENKTNKPVAFPANLSISDIYYFMFAPTLCYELNFPRTPERRWTFIFKRIIELISFACVILALCQQWILPLLKNSIAPFSEMDIVRCIERLLKLAIPNHIIWLMLFYLYFHSFLNLLAELLRFSDRQFYLDFWNSESISTFWKTWNIPVHVWAVRHVYKPFVRNGWGSFTASVLVFSISAFFHEYLVSVPLQMFRLWASLGMLAQLPLGTLTDKYLKSGRAGNIVVWLSLILGQPMAILMYLHDWHFIHFPEEHFATDLNATIISK